MKVHENSQFTFFHNSSVLLSGKILFSIHAAFYLVCGGPMGLQTVCVCVCMSLSHTRAYARTHSRTPPPHTHTPQSYSQNGRHVPSVAHLRLAVVRLLHNQGQHCSGSGYGAVPPMVAPLSTAAAGTPEPMSQYGPLHPFVGPHS